MKKNVGLVDSIIRLIVAAVFLVLFFTKIITGVWGVVVLILAIVFVVTGLLKFCPIYTLFGVNTLNCTFCKRKE